MNTGIEHELRAAVEHRCRPNLDDIDAAMILQTLGDLREVIRLHHEDRLKNSTERRKSLVTGGKGSGGMFGNLLEDAYLNSELGKLTVQALEATKPNKSYATR